MKRLFCYQRFVLPFYSRPPKFLLIVFLSFFTLYNNVSAVEQRSKEAVCLIVGYQNCLINNYSNISQIETKNKLLKNSAADCWRISRTNDKPRASSCNDDECLWGGGCVSIANDENDGYHTTEDLPISAFYDDAHTITISFPTYLDTVLYVLESRPLVKDDQQEQPWTFAGVSNETSISYRILNICQKYEFRPTAILNNGTIISFLPKVPSANPPDFIIDTLKLDKRYYDESEKKAVAVFTWKTPYGYTNNDITRNDFYLHPVQCDISGEYAVTKKLMRTDDGGAIRIEFPENMVQMKCKFLLTVWANNVCNAKTVTDARQHFELSCTLVEGYKCPDSELKPKCITHIVTSVASYDKSSEMVSVNATWLAPGSNTPEYYHVKWGVAELVDAQQKMPHPPPPPPPPSVGSERRPPPPPHPPMGPNFDISVWILKVNSINNERVDGDSTSVTLNNLHMNNNYGLQVCAIYNADFKTPEWPVVPVSGFTCVCTETETCTSENAIRCQDPDLFKLDKNFVTKLSPSTVAPKTRLGMVFVPSHNGISPPPTSIGPVQDFTQSLVGWELSGLKMTLNWNPPAGVTPDQMSDYKVSFESLTECNGTEICCNFAKFPEMQQTARNSSQISLLVNKDVLRANCQFMVKIISVAINGAQSVSLKNIVVPKPIALHETETAKMIETTMKGNSRNGAALEKSNDMDPFNAEEEIQDKQLPPHMGRLKINCTTMQCSHDCDETGCLCPFNFTMLFDNKTCIENDAVNLTSGEHAFNTQLPRCQQLGCQYWCNQKGDCVCPSAMQLATDGKTCIYRDPDTRDMTAPPPLPTIAYDPGYWCAQEENQVTIVQQSNRDVYLTWENQSWVAERSKKNYKSPIVVRWGETKTIPFMNLLKLVSNETTMVLSDVSRQKILIGRIHTFKRYGFQFCIFENDNMMEKINWKLPVVLPLSNAKTNQENSLKTVQSSSVVDSNFNDVDQNSMNVKKIVVLAVVIPLCCLIIIVSVSILLCHFYPEPVKRLGVRICSTTNRFFRRTSSNSLTNNCQGVARNECMKNRRLFNKVSVNSDSSKSKLKDILANNCTSAPARLDINISIPNGDSKTNLGSQ